MEQSIKRDEDLVGCTIEGVMREHGRLYLKLNGDRHAVIVASPSAQYDYEPILDEPDVIELARHGFITIDQLMYEIREETAGHAWLRVKELADALDIAERLAIDTEEEGRPLMF